MILIAGVQVRARNAFHRRGALDDVTGMAHPPAQPIDVVSVAQALELDPGLPVVQSDPAPGLRMHEHGVDGEPVDALDGRAARAPVELVMYRADRDLEIVGEDLGFERRHGEYSCATSQQ